MRLIKYLIPGLSIIFCFSLITTAQTVYTPVPKDQVPRITGYLEILGNSGFYTINSDITFPNSTGFRLGVMPYPFLEDERLITDEINNVLVVLMPYHLFGNGANRLEVGGGLLLGEVESDWDFIKPPGITATIGYRRHPSPDKPLLFRIGITPVLSKDKLFFRAGISFGWLINGR